MLQWNLSNQDFFKFSNIKENIFVFPIPYSICAYMYSLIVHIRTYCDVHTVCCGVQQVLVPYDPKSRGLRVDKNICLRVYCRDKARGT